MSMALSHTNTSFSLQENTGQEVRGRKRKSILENVVFISQVPQVGRGTRRVLVAEQLATKGQLGLKRDFTSLQPPSIF